MYIEREIKVNLQSWKDDKISEYFAITDLAVPTLLYMVNL